LKSKLLPIVFIIAFVAFTSLACAGLTDAAEVAVTPTEVNNGVGLSRANPYPVGQVVSVEDMTFEITGITRPADSIVAAANVFNTAAKDGQEYLFIKMKITCELPADDTCTFSLLNFSIVESDGSAYDAELFVADVADMLGDQDFAGGEVLEGNIAFIIHQAETDPVLMYESFSQETFYMQVK
jgi:hypothetical protein